MSNDHDQDVSVTVCEKCRVLIAQHSGADVICNACWVANVERGCDEREMAEGAGFVVKAKGEAERFQAEIAAERQKCEALERRLAWRDEVMRFGANAHLQVGAAKWDEMELKVKEATEQREQLEARLKEAEGRAADLEGRLALMREEKDALRAEVENMRRAWEAADASLERELNRERNERAEVESDLREKLVASHRIANDLRAELDKVENTEPFLLRIAELEQQEASAKEAARSLRQEVQDFLKGMNEETARAVKAEQALALEQDRARSLALHASAMERERDEANAERVKVVEAVRTGATTNLEPLFKRIQEAESKRDVSIALGLERQRRTERLEVELESAEKVSAELEEILTAWEEAFEVAKHWAPRAAYDDDGDLIEKDRGDWTVEEWRQAIAATKEAVSAEMEKIRNSHHQCASMFHVASREASAAKAEVKELRSVVKELRRWLAEDTLEREQLRAKVAEHEASLCVQADNGPWRV